MQGAERFLKPPDLLSASTKAKCVLKLLQRPGRGNAPRNCVMYDSFVDAIWNIAVVKNQKIFHHSLWLKLIA